MPDDTSQYDELDLAQLEEKLSKLSPEQASQLLFDALPCIKETWPDEWKDELNG